MMSFFCLVKTIYRGQEGYLVMAANAYTSFYISNLVAKAPSPNLGKKFSNLFSNREALNQYPTFCIFFPSNVIWIRTTKFKL